MMGEQGPLLGACLMYPTHGLLFALVAHKDISIAHRYCEAIPFRLSERLALSKRGGRARPVEGVIPFQAEGNKNGENGKVVSEWI